MELFFTIFTAVLVVVIFVEVTILLSRRQARPRVGGKSKVYVDTSSLMDGRILAIAKTNFISSELVIPRSVIRELQLLADGKDSEKRTRARHGLDVANELERADYVNCSILQDELDHTPVDERLLQLAKANGSAILTNDYNLGKVAATEHIKILNVNELALVLRVAYLPGERFELAVTAVGSNRDQGVGYLPDGTMVVVDDAANKVGKTVKVEFVRYIQTTAGRMMFAKLAAEKKPRQKPEGKKYRRRKSATEKAEQSLLDAVAESEEF